MTSISISNDCFGNLLRELIFITSGDFENGKFFNESDPHYCSQSYHRRQKEIQWKSFESTEQS